MSYDEGISEGLTRGISQKQTEIAKSLLSSNMSLKDVSYHTGLSIEEIEKLINKESSRVNNGSKSCNNTSIKLT